MVRGVFYSFASWPETAIYWRCHSAMLPYQIAIAFDKGSRGLGFTISGSLSVSGLPYDVALGDPFSYGGGTFSIVGDLESQMRAFFDEYHRMFPHVIDVLSRGMAAAELAASQRAWRASSRLSVSRT